VLTSRNINGGPITDYMMSGLNYQIEHHLFPNMPRANLRLAQPIVQQYCERIGISYLSTGLVESYRIGLRRLHEPSGELCASFTKSAVCRPSMTVMVLRFLIAEVTWRSTEANL
jgi:fatty acid desaturase